MKSLWELLRQLSHWEQKRLRKFLQSPYFTTDARMLAVMEGLVGDELPDKKALFTRACPEVAYSDARLHNLLSYFREQVEAWLAQEQLKAEPFSLALARLRIARNRGLTGVFDKEIRRQAKPSSTPMEREGLLQAYQLSEARDLYQLANRQPQSTHLRQQMEHLNDFHALALLQGACQWINRKQVVQSDPEDARQLDRYVAQALALPELPDSAPLIRLYQLLLRMLHQPEVPTAYPAFSEALFAHMDQLAGEEVRALCQYGQNYCIRQANQGRSTFLSELFRLYRVLLDRDLMYYQGYLQDADVKNMVALGVRLGKFGWTEAFLTTYAERILPARRDEVLAYNRAYLYHGKGELRKALRLLRAVDFQDVYYELGIGTLLLKIYYELEDHEGLEAQLRAFEQRLKRNRLISTYQRRGHLNLIRFLRKMDQYRIRSFTYPPRQRRLQLTQLQQHLSAQPAVINSTWLEAQLAALSHEPDAGA